MELVKGLTKIIHVNIHLMFVTTISLRKKLTEFTYLILVMRKIRQYEFELCSSFLCRLFSINTTISVFFSYVFFSS